jgi:pimeloyl-ACP methyl ester carboxylesterase
MSALNGRWCLSPVAGLILLCSPLLVRAQEPAAASPPFSPTGRLVDVGGWLLHINCTGERQAGQPTVVLEAGKGDFSVDWSLVQPGIERHARVCSYDRAGDGWSEMGPHPRTFRQIVHELNVLLREAGESAPYVLVGHSYGSWLVRAYQATYPESVVGLVLVESGASDPWRLMPDGELVRSSALATGRPIPPVKTTGPLRESDIPPGALGQMRAGLAQSSASANEPPRDKLPASAQRMRAWALGQLGHVAAAVNPVEYEELAALRADAAKSEYPLGDLPLVVITRGRLDETGPRAEALENEHQRDQAAMARMSRKGRQVIAARSGHHVPLDEPEIVIRTLEELLTAIRK